MIYLYVIRSVENAKRYVGITANIGSRMRTHARHRTKGGQQLGRFELLHREEFPDNATARVREKFLKSGQGRRWLDAKLGRMTKETDIDTMPVRPSVRLGIGV